MHNTHRCKRTGNLVRLTREAELTVNDLVYPMFVVETPRPGEALPGLPFYTLDAALHACEKACTLGVPGVMVFDIVHARDEKGLVALDDSLFTARIFRSMKREFGDSLLLFSNTGICSYRKDGSCIDRDASGTPLIRETCDMIGRIAAAHASFGADIISLPEMADGQVQSARRSLDALGLDHIPTMSLVKSDSCLFEPFQEAMGNEGPRLPSFRFRTDPANGKMFRRKIAIEVEEGVDIIAIKPASLYLDIVDFAHRRYPLPVGAFQVSGEYIMVKAFAEKTRRDAMDLAIESLRCIKRAGASLIMTYFAMEVARLLTGRSQRTS